jgi:steroid delta-isomerase-like uncharacterized protein
MTAQDNARIARTAYEAYNQKDFDRAAALAAENAQWTNMATGETFYGPEGFRQYLQAWATAFPDSILEITNQVADEDGVATQFTGRGSHAGPLHGPAGVIPPTGRSVEISFCEVMTMQDGKIVRAQLYFDLATMLRQLGLLPVPEQAEA